MGECSGTCPRCDAEIRYLDRQLNKKAQMGGRVSVADLQLREIELDRKRPAVRDGFNGITFGGGEPLLYAEFIKEFAEYTQHKWSIVLETSLNVPQSDLEKVLGSVDKFIIDIKCINAGLYSAYTGGDNKPVVDNLIFLLSRVAVEKVVVRVPYIPGYTDDKDVEAAVEKLKALGVRDIEAFDYIIP